MTQDVLQLVQLDMEDMIEDLKFEWSSSKHYKFNPTAFYKVKSVGDWLMMCCPFHSEENPSFGIMKNYPYKFNCFGCGEYGDIAKLVAHVIGLPSELHGLHYIKKNYTAVSSRDRPKLDIEQLMQRSNDKDKKRTLPDEEIYKYSTIHHEYLKSRGFHERTLNAYEVGYDEKTDCITFPVRTRGGLLRFIGRRSVKDKKFLNEKGVYKKDILYGLCYLLSSSKKHDTVFITESIIDTMSCYQCGFPACAVMGRILFQEQVRELILAGIKKVNLFFDNDEPGVMGMLSAYELLSKTPIIVNAVLYPGKRWGIDTLKNQEIEFKDANDLLVGRRLKEIEVVPFLQYRQMLLRDVLTSHNKTALKK